jgi:uncharacterized protein
MEFIQPSGGAGLGLRRSLMPQLQNSHTQGVDFFEVAPENWLHLGGRLAKQWRAFSEAHPIICHGLSLSIGSTAPLNLSLLQDIKTFIRTHQIRYYSEHISYTGDAAQLYELFPLPMTWEAIKHTAARVRQCQDILGQRIALENATYYMTPQQDMPEVEFINALLTEADCDLLLDVNNLFVNSQNHSYDPIAFLQQIPAARVAYIHIAGHQLQPDHWRIDTHGEAVSQQVWQLLCQSYQILGVKPTLLERDFNVPPLQDLLAEIALIKQHQTQALTQEAQAQWIN